MGHMDLHDLSFYCIMYNSLSFFGKGIFLIKKTHCDSLFIEEIKGKLMLCPGTNVSRTANNAVEWCSTLHTQGFKKTLGACT